MAKPKPELPFIYSHHDVTPERVAEFAEADEHLQLRVLTELRSYVASEWTNSMIGVLTIYLAFAAVVLALPASETSVMRELGLSIPVELPPLVVAILASKITMLLLVAIIIRWLMWSVSRASLRRRRAAVWLTAYEAELARRFATKGRRARKWQSARPIQWSHL